MKTKYYVLIAAFLLPILLQAQNKSSFSAELKLNYTRINTPVAGWYKHTSGLLVPELEFGYKNKYFLKGRFLGRLDPTEDESAYYFYMWPKLSKSDAQQTEISSRFYIAWDVVASYQLLDSRKHRLMAGVGATHRKGWEDHSAYILYPDKQPEWICYGPSNTKAINSWGVLGEVSYSYNVFTWFTAGSTLCYRAYTKGDPVLTGSVNVGVMLWK